ncbi:Uncharacterized protein FWK35_00030684 [Aphis craccivora]|uniref:Uncharacterized protein n=1 Tax=Aphis craccivora TaxID=307492 RepID=A0A6G0VYV7_APHCR|nr:Uncharacterized protein FWK35_00030684 [Aphis craccivora]
MMHLRDAWVHRKAIIRYKQETHHRLISPIKTIIKARNPKTLKVVKQLAKAEEVEYKSDRDNNYRQNNNNFQRTNNKRNYNTIIISELFIRMDTSLETLKEYHIVSDIAKNII